MLKRTVAPLVFAVFTLASCQTPAQLQAARQKQLEGMCATYGIQPGDPSFSECMMQADAALRMQEAQRSAALGALGGQLLQQSGPRYLPSQPISTSCYQAGATVQCTTIP